MPRECGTCALCCKLLPVKELDKPPSKWCTHARPGAQRPCTIYSERPRTCKVWSCVWLTNDDSGPALRRPDQSHYVIDPAPDFVGRTLTMRDGSTQTERIPVIQVWCDPNYPDAWRDPALQEVMLKMSYARVGTVIRFGSERGIVIFPPPISPDGQWMIIPQRTTGEENTIEDIISVATASQIPLIKH